MDTMALGDADAADRAGRRDRRPCRARTSRPSSRARTSRSGCVLAAFACGGHVLLEDVPGTAKTVLARSLAGSIEGATVSRIQCTPDLQPTDVTGLSVWNPSSRAFEFQPRPDLRERRSSSTRSTGRCPRRSPRSSRGWPSDQVTVDGITHRAARPVSRHRDREHDRARRNLPACPRRSSTGSWSAPRSATRPSTRSSRSWTRSCTGIRSSASGPSLRPRSSRTVSTPSRTSTSTRCLKRWALELVRATREMPSVEVGASVRGSLALERMARAWALASGRSYVVAGGRRAAACVRSSGHRLVLSRDALLSADRGEREIVGRRPGAVPRADAAAGAGMGDGDKAAASVSGARAATFRLVPLRRFVGARVGEHRSPRRGAGDEVAGTRPYRPGDRRTWIDWRASARLSAARGTDEFVVREFFADTAPRAVLAVDRRPRMGLHDSRFPVARQGCRDRRGRPPDRAAPSRPSAVTSPSSPTAPEAPVGRAPRAAQGPRAPRARRRRAGVRRESPIPRPLPPPPRRARSLASRPEPSSSSSPTSSRRSSPHMWRRLRALRWDVTPVVVQDPTWEQSFPDVGGVLLPLGDVQSGIVRDVWIRRSDARARAVANERRLDDLVAGFKLLGFDPVLVGSSDPGEIAHSFARWSERRARLRRRSA